MKKKFNKKEYMRKYMKEYLKEYSKKPEFKERRRILAKELYQTKDRKDYLKKYVKDNKEEIKRNTLKYSRSEKGIKKNIEYREIKRDKKKHNKYMNNWIKNKIKNDLSFAIEQRLRRRLNHAINRYIKDKKYMKSNQFHIDYEKVIEHLKPFPKDIENYHIDHIVPLCLFDFNNPIHIKKAFAPENHQWLTIKDNCSKGSKYKNE